MLDPKTSRAPGWAAYAAPARWQALDLSIAAALAAGLAAFAAASWLGLPTSGNPETTGRHAPSTQADRRA